MKSRSHAPRGVCVVGQHELDYPRNIVNQRLMREAGFEITLCHQRGPWFGRTLSIVGQYLLRGRRAQVAFATEGAHRHMPWLKLATVWTGHKIVFDPFISRYNTEVEDRKFYRPYSVRALRASWQDYAACASADYLVFDTVEHKDYFYRRYRLRKPFAIVRVGVEEDVFYPREPQPSEVEAGRCEVLFYGTYIPLQGVPIIVRAAELLRGEAGIHFTLIGDGQEFSAVRAEVERAALPNLTLERGLQPPAQLAARIAAADVCLGIFDDGIKAGHVVPNKVVQCAAMAKPIITRESSAVARDFVHGESVWMVPPGDARALANAVLALARSRQERAVLSRGARSAFERAYSVKSQVEIMRALLVEASASS